MKKFKEYLNKLIILSKIIESISVNNPYVILYQNSIFKSIAFQVYEYLSIKSNLHPTEFIRNF